MNPLSFSTLCHSRLFGPGPDLAEQVAAAAAAGFAGVGADVFSLRSWVDDGHRLGALAEVLGAHGLACTDLAGHTVGADAEASQREADELGAMASALSAEWVQMRVVEPLDDRVRALARDCAERLAVGGAGVALEPSSFTVLTDLRIAGDLAAELRSVGRAGVVVDSWHFLGGGRADPDDADWDGLAALATSGGLAFVQFTDALEPGADARHDTMRRRTLPGAGRLDLARFAAAVRATGFDGWVSVEILSEVLQAVPVGDFAAQARAATAPYWR
jgi:sugar phosphate isomerase/epimerase